MPKGITYLPAIHALLEISPHHIASRLVKNFRKEILQFVELCKFLCSSYSLNLKIVDSMIQADLKRLKQSYTTVLRNQARTLMLV